MEQVFKLLDHWRGRQDDGHEPLIWVSTCPLFQDTDKRVRHGRSLRRDQTAHPYESDEEVFDLPASDDVDEGEMESDGGLASNESEGDPPSDNESSDSQEDASGMCNYSLVNLSSSEIPHAEAPCNPGSSGSSGPPYHHHSGNDTTPEPCERYITWIYAYANTIATRYCRNIEISSGTEAGKGLY